MEEMIENSLYQPSFDTFKGQKIVKFQNLADQPSNTSAIVDFINDKKYFFIGGILCGCVIAYLYRKK